MGPFLNAKWGNFEALSNITARWDLFPTMLWKFLFSRTKNDCQNKYQNPLSSGYAKFYFIYAFSILTIILHSYKIPPVPELKLNAKNKEIIEWKYDGPQLKHFNVIFDSERSIQVHPDVRHFDARELLTNEHKCAVQAVTSQD